MPNSCGSRALRIGLTGGIGSGKSTVTTLFQARGAPIIDADIVARELVLPGSPGLQAIIDRFGLSVLAENGHLDRNTLRELVFTDKQNRKALESILHPHIRHEMDRQAEAAQAPYVILTIPLLLETGRIQDMDRVLVVDIPENEQIRRVALRDGHSHELIADIMASQCSRQERLDSADDVISNTGPQDSLIAQVDRLHEKYVNLTKPF